MKKKDVKLDTGARLVLEPSHLNASMDLGHKTQ